MYIISKLGSEEEAVMSKPTPILSKLLEKNSGYTFGIQNFLPELSNDELIGLLKEASGDDKLQSYIVDGFFLLPQERLVDILSTHTIELIQTLGHIGEYSFINSLFKLDQAILLHVLNTDNVLGLLRNIEPRHMVELIDNLFSLPKDIIQPLIAAHRMSLFEASGNLKGYFAIKLLKSFPEQASDPGIALRPDNVLRIATESDVYKSLFFHTLLELPSKQLESIITRDNMTPLFSMSDEKLVFIHKLLNFSKEVVENILTPSNMKEIFAWIQKPSYLPTTTIQQLLDKFESKDIKLSMEVTKDLDFSYAKDLIFLKLSTSLIDFIEPDCLEALHPLVVQLLSKTYIQVESPEAGRSFANSWIGGLNKIIPASPSLTTILRNAVEESGDIFVTNSEYIKISTSGVVGCFLNPIIGIANKPNDAVRGLDTLIHEATHKLIDNTYHNDMLPYPKGGESNFTSIKEAMSAELIKEKVLYSRLYIDKWHEYNLSIGDKLPQDAVDSLIKESWLKTMIHSYPQDKFAIEILPWFTQHIAQNILGNQKCGGVGRGLDELLWDYLNKYLTPNPEPEPLPAFSYHEYEFLEDEEGSLTYNAKKLVTMEEPSIRWLDDEVGQLAFQSLPLSDQIAFINQLFVSPESELDESNIVKVFQHSSVLSYTLIEKLFELPREQLLSLVTHGNIHFLIRASGDYKFELIDKTLTLLPQDLSSIITDDNLEEVVEASDNYAYKLLVLLPPSPDEAEVIVHSENAPPPVEDAESPLASESCLSMLGCSIS